MFKKWWFFIMALLLQVGLMFLIIIPQWTILAYGREVVLETEPYDPYTIFSGYYADLRYKIENVEPVSDSNGVYSNQRFFVLLKRNQEGTWDVVRAGEQPFRKLGPDEAQIRGKVSYNTMEYGIEQYYLPEDQRERVDKLLSKRDTKVLVTVRLAADGRAAIQSLRIGKEVFKY
jgi:uncharacterized membrane-anchored protein